MGDLHLAFGVPSKSMELLNPLWRNYASKIRESWLQSVQQEDLVLIPGDISWAMKFEEALPDLRWLAALPGSKLLLRGNHDYWWGSVTKMRQALPPSLFLLQNDAFHWKSWSFAGSRMWDSPEYSFSSYIEGLPIVSEERAAAVEERKDDERIFERELQRLELSLKALDPHASHRVALTHYPPIGPDLEPSRVSLLLEKYEVQLCVFGHLHNVKKSKPLFGEHHGIRYVLASADYLDFSLLHLTPLLPHRV